MSLTHQLWAQHKGGEGAGFTVPGCSLPIQKLILLLWDSKNLASHLHWWWGEEEGREGEDRRKRKGGGGGSSGRMTSPFLKCHHYLKPRLSCLQGWHHPLIAPPPSVLSEVVCGEGGTVFCLCACACSRECAQESIFRRSMSGCLSARLLSCFILSMTESTPVVL